MLIASLYPCPNDPDQTSHDASAAIFADGRIYAYEEGKITQIKSDASCRFPERSLMMGFKELGILPGDIDRWVFPAPSTKLEPLSFKSLFNHLKAYNDELDFEEWFSKKVTFVPHQILHASLGIFASPFESCTFICMDGGGGGGDPRGFIFGEYDGKEIKILRQSIGMNSIAVFHAFVTDSLGFNGLDNGKVSGLAGYGSVIENLKNEFEKLIEVNENGIKFDRKRFERTPINLSKIRPDEFDRSKVYSQYPSDTNILRIDMEYLPQDIAKTAELVVQLSFLKLLKQLRPLTRFQNLVLSGGLFQNVSLNNAIFESGEFEEYYFPMAAADSGLSLGGALLESHKENSKSGKKTKPKESLTPFLGPSYSNIEIENILKNGRLHFHKIDNDNLESQTARLISEGKVVGWFQGRGEYGPRSLGARSILADPRSFDSKSKINQLLKKRDWFMPYAPAILEENLHEWVERPTDSPYMQIAFKLKSEMASLIPAAVHVDGSSRIQTVSKTKNLRYWNLINQFKNITGIPVLLNTSFNRHGISTIASPRQAISHLLEGCMDVLVIENFFVYLNENRLCAPHALELESEENLLKKDCISRLLHFRTKGTTDQFHMYCDNLFNFIDFPKNKYPKNPEVIVHLISELNEHLLKIN